MADTRDIGSPRVRRAKLGPPRFGTGLVPRPRLVELLNRGLEVPVTLVVGPAGFGKTTALGEWTATIPYPATWLTLDEGDTDLARFVVHVIAALRAISPTIGVQTLDLLNGPLPPPNEFGETLADELLNVTEPFVLVIDDLHEAVESWLLTFLTALLRYPPPSLRLVISTRWDPRLPIARLRGRGLLAEVRTGDLRFTEDETRSLLRHAIGGEPEASIVTLLQERTEGWVAGLRLASIALRGCADSESLAASFAAIGERHIMIFLLDEVLIRQPEQVQQFLLRTSITNRICGSLADSLTELDLPAGASESILEGLARASLYIEPIGDEPVWYRFHPLFRDLLRQRLTLTSDPGAIADLHARQCLVRGSWESRRGRCPRGFGGPR
jgi:LuxR family transcriptional regulator, maltose regulon positive regulatory protein